MGPHQIHLQSRFSLGVSLAQKAKISGGVFNRVLNEGGFTYAWLRTGQNSDGDVEPKTHLKFVDL